MSFPPFTKTYHNDTYAAIFPTKPELSVAGKTVIISGAGSGIGRETAIAFAQAGAGSIVLLGGRRENLLREAADAIASKNAGTKVQVLPCDITDEKAVTTATKSLQGKWDIALLNSGYLSGVAKLADADIEDWWKGYEINVKGNAIVTKALLPLRNKDACLIGTSSAAMHAASFLDWGLSSYFTSKLAFTNLMESVAAENKDLHVVTFHPGTVATDMNLKFNSERGSDAAAPDKVELPAHFAVWLASEDARFLRGRYVWCNWDVQELAEMKEKFQTSALLTVNTLGWPLAV